MDTLSALAVPICMIMFFNIAPLFFLCILRRNRNKLDTPECRAKYGQMYETIFVQHIDLPSILGIVKSKN